MPYTLWMLEYSKISAEDQSKTRACIHTCSIQSKLQKLKKEQKICPHEMNIESKYLYTDLIFLSYFFMTHSFDVLLFNFASCKKFGQDRNGSRKWRSRVSNNSSNKTVCLCTQVRQYTVTFSHITREIIIIYFYVRAKLRMIVSVEFWKVRIPVILLKQYMFLCPKKYQ